MDEATFWNIIGEARSGADDEVFLARLTARLRAIQADDIVEFQRLFNRALARSYSWNLWGAAHLVRGGCSDDKFEYFRAWLISQGQGPFERAVEDPETLVSFVTPNAILESFTYAAFKVYEEKTGTSLPDSVYDGVVRPKLGERWDFDDAGEMKKRYPRLFARFSGK